MSKNDKSLMDALKDIDELAGRVQRLKNALTGEDLAKILRTVAGNHLETAIRNLEDMSLSLQPERELEIALSHLHGALTAFGNAGGSAFTRFFQQRLTPESLMNDYRQACVVATLVVLCNRQRGEPALVAKYARFAEDYYDLYLEATEFTKSGNMRIWGQMGNPGFSQYDPDMVRLKQEFDFLRSLLAALQGKPPPSPTLSFSFKLVRR